MKFTTKQLLPSLEVLRSPAALVAIKVANTAALAGLAVLRHTAYVYLALALLRQYDAGVPKQLDDTFVLEFFSPMGLMLALALGAVVASVVWLLTNGLSTLDTWLNQRKETKAAVTVAAVVAK
jgi:hypothetical protein